MKNLKIVWREITKKSIKGGQASKLILEKI